jgi:hypothetical protein
MKVSSTEIVCDKIKQKQKRPKNENNTVSYTKGTPTLRTKTVGQLYDLVTSKSVFDLIMFSICVQYVKKFL